MIHRSLSCLLCFFMVISLCSFIPKKSQKTILVVVAHPDDETAFCAALAKFVRLGYKVQMIVAVDGRFRIHTKASTPDSAALKNKNESICSCEQLGISKPIFYDLISLDRKYGAKDGVRDAVESGVRFRDSLKSSILQYQPDLIISFGPDGEYGHPEHIAVSSLITELLLREGWAEKYPLYYFGWPKSLEQGNDGWVRYVDDTYFNVVVTYNDDDERRAIASINCYSAFSQAEKDQMREEEQKRKNELFFRKFVIAKGFTKEFFSK